MSSALRRRRNGQIQACEPCRKVKIRCDHGTPSCGRCTRRNLACVYHLAPLTRARDSSIPTIPADSYDGESSSLDSSRPSVTGSWTPLSDGAQSNALFPRPLTSYGSTRFSAVFSENQASLGPAILDAAEEYRHPAEATNVTKELAISTLLNFPTRRTCEALLRKVPFMVEIWQSPTMTKHCLSQIWSEYGTHLGDQRCRASVSQMANDIFENTKHVVRQDNNAYWHNWFGGPRLRWEMLGIVFTVAGFAFKHLQEWDPVFSLPEQQGRNRKTGADKMRECADACLQLCQDNELNDVTVVLMKNIWKLQSIILTDESDRIRTGSAMVASACVTAGLHRLPADQDPTPASLYRHSLSASLYYHDKCESLFYGRPPLASHRYCTYQLPLDLSEEEMYGGPEIFATAKARLDPRGWNTSGKIHILTYLRALCLQSSIREEILELSLGVDSHFTETKIDNLITRLDDIVSSYPPHLQYANISQYSSFNSSREFYLVTRIHLAVLQCRFLLQRLAISRGYTTGQALFDIANEMMTVVLSLWLGRDKLKNYNYSFDWIVVSYGIPSAGVLCLEFLNSSKLSSTHPNMASSSSTQQTGEVDFSRSNVIQSLTIFIAFLAWIRPTDGNADLCWRLRKVCTRVVDRVLDAPPTSTSTTTSNSASARNPASASTYMPASVHAGFGHMSEKVHNVSTQEGGFEGGGGFGPLLGSGSGSGPGSHGFDDGLLGLQSDDLDWLNTVDWTQGNWLDMNIG